MTEIVIKGRVKLPPINWIGVPETFVGKVAAVCRTQAEAEDLVAWFGSAEFCPYPPILLLIPGTGGVILAGLGLATAAELRDDAVGIWEMKRELIAKTGAVLDFDELRERAGLMRREDVPARMAEAFEDRIQRHKSSPVTDPARQPNYPRPNERTLHTVADRQDWKD